MESDLLTGILAQRKKTPANKVVDECFSEKHTHTRKMFGEFGGIHSRQGRKNPSGNRSSVLYSWTQTIKLAS
ncbi:MAG: hypothetical protein ACI87E_000772, partial [Mariniblastus sp.]